MNNNHVVLMCLLCTAVPIFGRLDQQLINKWTQEDAAQWDQKKVDSMMDYLKKNAKGNESTIKPVRTKIENRWIDELKTRKAAIEPVLAKAKTEKNRPQELKAQTNLVTTVDNLIKTQTESAATLAPEADTPAEKKELAEKQQEIAQLKETKQKLETTLPSTPITTVTPPPVPGSQPAATTQSTAGTLLPPPPPSLPLAQPKAPSIITQTPSFPSTPPPPPFIGGTIKQPAPDASTLPPIPGTQPATSPKAPTLITQTPSILLPPPPPLPQQKPSTAETAAQGITPEQLQAIRAGSDLKPVGPIEKQKPADPFLADLERQKGKLKPAGTTEKPKEEDPFFKKIKEKGSIKSGPEEASDEWDDESTAQPASQAKETPVMQQAHQRAQENLAKALTILENEKAPQAEKDTVNSFLNEGLKAANTLVFDQQQQYIQLKDALFALKGKNIESYTYAASKFNALPAQQRNPATLALAERAKKVAATLSASKPQESKEAKSGSSTSTEPSLSEEMQKRRRSLGEE